MVSDVQPGSVDISYFDVPRLGASDNELSTDPINEEKNGRTRRVNITEWCK